MDISFGEGHHSTHYTHSGGYLIDQDCGLIRHICFHNHLRESTISLMLIKQDM